MVQDPVCGMRVEEQEARDKSEVGERTLYFCSSQCKKEFDREPQRYLTQGGRPTVEEQSQPRI